MQLSDGIYQYLEGGVNTRFNLPLMRSKFIHSFESLPGESATDLKQSLRTQATDKIIAALDKVHAEDPGYFYKNFEFGGISKSAVEIGNGWISPQSVSAPIQYLVSS